MDAPEIIKSGKKILAMVFPAKIRVSSGVSFFTAPDNPFQIGMHNREKGTHLAAHIHRLDHPLTINAIQELLVVVSGTIRVTIYTRGGKRKKSVTLTSGDSILLMDGGHSVEFLEDSNVFELKQGPYRGPINAKIFLKP